MKHSLLLPALLLLSACSIGGPKIAVQVFDPAVAAPAAPAGPAVDWSISVATPQANALIDSDRIAVRPAPDQLQTYKGARWADTGPELVQTAVVRALEDSGRFAGVVRAGASGRRGDVALYSELRHFETHYRDGQPVVVVELQARLVGRDGRLATRRFREEATPATPQVEAVVHAFGQAMSSLSAAVRDWALAEGAAAAPAAP